MMLLQDFLDRDHCSLKICGVTNQNDATKLADLGVPAMGVNFWPQSKRHCSPEIARGFLGELADRILRVGVFVNNAPALAPALLQAELLDAIQLHGDEDDSVLESFLSQGVPSIRSLALTPESDLAAIIARYQNLLEKHTAPLALLLDAHAPGIYGGTGEAVDWEQAATFIEQAAPLPVILAGGLKPGNVTQALATTHPAAIDLASGAESSPGVKDFEKVRQLLAAIPARPS